MEARRTVLAVLQWNPFPFRLPDSVFKWEEIEVKFKVRYFFHVEGNSPNFSSFTPIAPIFQPLRFSANYHYKITKECFNKIFIFLLSVLFPQYLPKLWRYLQISPLMKGTISASPA